MFVLNVWKLDMMNDVLGCCVDEQRVFSPYETKLKMQFSRKGHPQWKWLSTVKLEKCQD